SFSAIGPGLRHTKLDVEMGACHPAIYAQAGNGYPVQQQTHRLAGLEPPVDPAGGLVESISTGLWTPGTGASHGTVQGLSHRHPPGVADGPVLLAHPGLSACMARTVPAAAITCRRTKHGAASPTAAPAPNPCQQPVSRCASLARARSTASGTFAGQARG